MKLPHNIPIYGDTNYRGKCPNETPEQVSFFNWIRQKTDCGPIAIHIRNEAKRHYTQANKHKVEGMCAGAADIIIPGNPAFVCELKRQDHTQCKISKDQIEFLTAAQNNGAFVCIALGCAAALEAFEEWKTKILENGRP